mmetsp:Transcript_11569/g.26822  ORF Transcript_11569/g.26822 Transcript_11569/m.26822 type:complete len:156 (+) Transcript_11569:188-655(+)|eukprot:CAMPEP_0201130298 /NCGR_PEP_ID=MMETSP0850-20130426/39441_1 /ASSEMBLY_ACC=CAM_ASM_000622 /TAXON_ID=183588 /ORGANISM="Pseudo-nitzschia fraudulenta, Strain WWA7" /LENGTH=155 /DNA_ID=CAMNT_0047400031 /DNA_START=171 /DNA_END=638 /DNA_ORIENTATION=+
MDAKYLIPDTPSTVTSDDSNFSFTEDFDEVLAFYGNNRVSGDGNSRNSRNKNGIRSNNSGTKIIVNGNNMKNTVINSNSYNKIITDNTNKYGHPESDAENSEKNRTAFAKSQIALNKAYRHRRLLYKRTPLSARMETGKNLQNILPLAVRTAEFC